MGLYITAAGFNEEIYSSGYIGFTYFRIALAKAYNTEFGALYEKWIFAGRFGNEPMTTSEFNRLNELCNDDFDILLKHSDCDGKLTPKECKAIYEVTNNLKCDYPQNNYLTVSGKNQLEVLNRALLHCWKRKVNMYFRQDKAMTFEDALHNMRKGHRLFRQSKPDLAYSINPVWKNTIIGENLSTWNVYSRTTFRVSDILATDWEIVK